MNASSRIRLAVVGSRYFGAQVFGALAKEPGVDIVCVVAPAADDRLALAATQAGVALHVLVNPKIVPGEAIGQPVDLLIAAHTHARVSDEALAFARLGGVGYHPSLLPRHRGIAAVEWTVLEGDAIAGGSVYHLADGWDAGGIAAQDWCFVGKGENARELWERALAPMGLRLLTQVVRQARDSGSVDKREQDPRFATKAPMLRKAVNLQEDQAPSAATLAVTVIGPDRPGIVRQIADCALRHGASWAGSRMSRIGGHFAGTVELTVPRERAPGLQSAITALEGADLQIHVTLSEASPTGARQRRFVMEMVGEDRVGIVAHLANLLAARGISIDSLSTAVEPGGGAARFRIQARFSVGPSQDLDALQRELGELAQSLALDLSLDGEG